MEMKDFLASEMISNLRQLFKIFSFHQVIQNRWSQPGIFFNWSIEWRHEDLELVLKWV